MTIRDFFAMLTVRDWIELIFILLLCGEVVVTILLAWFGKL